MRVTSRSLPLALVLAASALIVSGCSPEAAVPSAPPAAEAEPLFASDEEALEAAEAAFKEYASVANTVLQEGGRDPERIRPLVSDEVWESDLADAERWQSEGWTSKGSTTVETATLQQVIDGNGTPTEVIAYLCLSNRDVDVVDSEGRSVISSDRAEAYVVEAVVSFEELDSWTIEAYEQTETVDSCG